MNVAVILAGGVGKRAGAGMPKQFVRVLGKPVLAYTLESFQGNANVDEIEVVCHRDHVDEIRAMAKEYGIGKARRFVTGGDTFQMSTMNGVMALKESLADDDVVLLHFAVSPMVTDEIIDDALRVCAKYGNAIATDDMVMCTCIRDSDGLGTTKGILRETIGGFNGPWAFRYAFVRSLYERASSEGVLATIEPHTTSIALHYGHKLYFSKSASTNIKITHPEDFDAFEGMLLVRHRRAQGIKREDPI